MAAKESFFIGATICGAQDATDYYGPVKVPGTMTKQSTIDAFIERARNARREHVSFKPMGFAGSLLPNDDQYENHAHRPMVGVLASVTVLDSAGEIAYHQKENGGNPVARGKVALPFIKYIAETFPQQFSASLRYGDSDPTAVFFGFGLKQILRIAAYEALKRNLEEHVNAIVPVRLWHNPIGVYDVLDVLLPAADRRDLDLYSTLRYFDVNITAEQLACSSQVQAAVAKQLVERAQLAP